MKQSAKPCTEFPQKILLVCKWHVLIKKVEKKQLYLHKNLFFYYFSFPLESEILEFNCIQELFESNRLRRICER